MASLIDEGVRKKGKRIVLEPLITEKEIFDELKSVQKEVKLKTHSFDNRKMKWKVSPANQTILSQDDLSRQNDIRQDSTLKSSASALLKTSLL